MEEGHCPLYMGSRQFPSKTEGEGGTLFAYYDLFFPLYSQTALQIVKLPSSSAFDCHQEGYMCDSWVVICLSYERSVGCLLRDGSRAGL